MYSTYMSTSWWYCHSGAVVKEFSVYPLNACDITQYLWQLSLMKTALGCRNIWSNFCHLQASVATNQICLAPQTFRLPWPTCSCSIPSCATSNLQAQPWPSSPTGLWWHVHVTTLWPLAVQVMTHWVDVTIPCHTVTTTVLTRSHLQLPALFY